MRYFSHGKVLKTAPCRNIRALRSSVDQWLRHLVRCRFYLRQKERMSMQPVFVLIIFFAVIGYILTRSNKKGGSSSSPHEVRSKSKYKVEAAKKKIINRASKRGVNYSDEEIEFILKTALDHSGIEGVKRIGETFESAPDKIIDQIMMKIEKEHLFSIVDNQKGPTR